MPSNDDRERAARSATAEKSGLSWDELDALIASLESLQEGKVVDLARRLRPGLTNEDIRNPHDFPELNDPDWHYADGILTGIQSVKMAIFSLRRGKVEDP